MGQETQETTAGWKQIRGLDEVERYGDEQNYLINANERLSTAQTTLAEATDGLEAAKQARKEQVDHLKSARVELGVAIALDESIDPIKRSIWARSFDLTEKVADPINYGTAVETLIDQVVEKLQPGTLLLTHHASGVGVARVETSGLVTDLIAEDAPAYRPTASGKNLSRGDITTPVMTTLSVDARQSFLGGETFKTKERSLLVRAWPDGDDRLSELKRVFIDNSSWLLIGEDQVRKFVEGEDQPKRDLLYGDIEKRKQFWAFVMATQLGCEFSGFDQTPRFQEWKDAAEQAITQAFTRLATDERRYESRHSIRSHRSSTHEVHGIEAWPKGHLKSLMDAFKIELATIKEKVRAGFDQEVSTALEASQKVRALANLNQIFEVLS